ncbi:MAG: hypothetical protein ACT4PO_15025 [Actinomycetota bacterium]
MSTAAGSPTPRAQPFYCPYCGEQDLRPDGQSATWHCRVCDRRFELAYLGLGGSVSGG